MKLRTECFDKAIELTEFVNTMNIKRENIQDIIRTYRGHWHLFYWEE